MTIPLGASTFCFMSDVPTYLLIVPLYSISVFIWMVTFMIRSLQPGHQLRVRRGQTPGLEV